MALNWDLDLSYSMCKRLVFLLKMLILLKSRKQRKHDMQWFNNIVISFFMNRNIKNVACNFTILFQWQIYLLTGGIHLRKHVLNFLWPYLHQAINIWHSFRIWNCWWLFIFMDIANWINPFENLLWVLFCLLNTVNFYVGILNILIIVVSNH